MMEDEIFRCHDLDDDNLRSFIYHDPQAMSFLLRMVGCHGFTLFTVVTPDGSCTMALHIVLQSTGNLSK